MLHPLVFGLLGVLAAAPAAYSDSSIVYNVNKTAIYIQTSGTGSVPDPKWPYVFGVQAESIAVTLELPDGATQPIPFDSQDNQYEYSQLFTTKAALDAAYPDGTYELSGSGLPTLMLPLTADNYPPSVPQVMSSTNATWSGGVLVVDPTKPATLNFSTFSTYATGGVGGYMQFDINDQLLGGKTLKQAIVSLPNSLGITQQSTPFTSYSIPSTTLNTSDIYLAELQYTTALKFDTTTVPGSAVLGMFQNYVSFFIVTPPSGTTPQPPVLATDLTSKTGHVGGSVNFAPAVTVGGQPISGTYLTLWYLDGQQLNIDGVKYVNNGTSLTINNLTKADAGVYAARFVNLGGLVATSNATLTVSAATAPVVTTQPMSQSLNAGSTVVFTVAASGSPTSYQWQFSTNSGASWTNLSDGNGISGSAGPQLEIQNASAADNAEYACLVTSAGGSTQSNPAALTVAASSDPGYLINISARSFVGTGGNIMIGGFYIVGSTSRSVLIQAIGPGLAGEGVTGVLQHPALSIHNSSGATIYSNTGWGSSQLLLNAAAAAYANPVLQANSADSELLLTLPPGGYTAEISGADGGTGVALCAIYQLP